jgi:hypothetical protein
MAISFEKDSHTHQNGCQKEEKTGQKLSHTKTENK